ncbi:hypothetical protein [Salinicoccus carnicancri]|uniref:hypothetical protein n=1 Tax=Salinicoccus carnicancri TaxID=558170 RepID=UPI0002E8F906|nr:hypothetical protein [Salinicoccus carnicancri]
MKKKIVALPLASMMALSSFASIDVNAASYDYENNVETVNKDSSLSNFSSETISIVDPHISVENGEFVIHEKNNLENKISTEKLEEVETSIEEMNSVIKEAEQVNYKTDSIESFAGSPSASSDQVTTFAVTAASNGKSGVEYHWWGYKVFFDNNQAIQIRNALGAGVTASGMANRLAPMFSVPQVAVKAISGALVAGGSGLVALIESNNNGNGIWIRVTGYAVYTGIGPQ